jgi:integrase
VQYAHKEAKMVRTNIYHRQDGRWEGRIPRGKRRNGNRKFQYFFGKTKEQVYEKMAQIRQFDANNKPCDRTVSELFSEWYQSIRHNIKESTASNYLLKMQKHILPAFREYRIDNLKASDVYDFIHKKQASGLSNRYIADIIILMKTMFKYAAKTYHIFNPMDEVTPPKKKSSEVKILDESEQKTLQTYIGEHQNRTTLGIALSLTIGIRIGELCALQWRDIDLKKRILTVSKTIQRIQCRDSETKTKLIITEPKSEKHSNPRVYGEFSGKTQGEIQGISAFRYGKASRTKDDAVSLCKNSEKRKFAVSSFPRITPYVCF